MLPMPRLLMCLALSLAACGGAPDERPGGGVDSSTHGGGDAPGGGNPGDGAVDTAMLPTWMLEDVQPQSPRAGQTYGLDAFTGQIIVVSLLEGF